MGIALESSLQPREGQLSACTRSLPRAKTNAPLTQARSPHQKLSSVVFCSSRIYLCDLKVGWWNGGVIVQVSQSVVGQERRNLHSHETHQLWNVVEGLALSIATRYNNIEKFECTRPPSATVRDILVNEFKLHELVYGNGRVCSHVQEKTAPASQRSRADLGHQQQVESTASKAGPTFSNLRPRLR